jgi:hypothetical protein
VSSRASGLREQNRPQEVSGHAGSRAQSEDRDRGRELREMMTFLKKKKEVGVPEEAPALAARK